MHEFTWNVVTKRPRRQKKSSAPDPDEVPIRFRFFEDAGDVADAESYLSGDGLGFDPHVLLPAVQPFQIREDQALYDEHARYAMVIVHHNGLMLGPCTIGPALGQIDVLHGRVFYNEDFEVNLELFIEHVDEGLEDIGPIVYGPMPGP